ncbi:hypothetical protein FDP41_001010 [Naegleria fowleri]|uniref:F-box domain-containing protein n=1 Tax=Naegleria fowleri TaxID=5763 RepID=A0A6A5BRQ1_NAEFO|nr:uncharacterized protein FDP41_001010 [Naegleria fowleri]KAF0979857.1 hypothetical protein FDP41_001010 [Naegleria fowleri]CAG4712044.1 unnamed protein product [Naegleria fowleri]
MANSTDGDRPVGAHHEQTNEEDDKNNETLKNIDSKSTSRTTLLLGDDQPQYSISTSSSDSIESTNNNIITEQQELEQPSSLRNDVVILPVIATLNPAQHAAVGGKQPTFSTMNNNNNTHHQRSIHSTTSSSSSNHLALDAECDGTSSISGYSMAAGTNNNRAEEDIISATSDETIPNGTLLIDDIVFSSMQTTTPSSVVNNNNDLLLDIHTNSTPPANPNNASLQVDQSYHSLSGCSSPNTTTIPEIKPPPTLPSIKVTHDDNREYKTPNTTNISPENDSKKSRIVSHRRGSNTSTEISIKSNISEEKNRKRKEALTAVHRNSYSLSEHIKAPRTGEEHRNHMNLSPRSKDYALVRFTEDNIDTKDVNLSARLTSPKISESGGNNFLYSSPALINLGTNVLLSVKNSNSTEKSDSNLKNDCLVMKLPDLVLLHIFTFLGIQYVEDNNYNLVCKRWYMTLCMDCLWRERYLTFFNSKHIQNNSMLLSYSHDFDFPQRNKFRFHLIRLRKKKYFLKQRILLQNRHENSRKYLLFNSLVLNPLVAIVCFMISTITFGLQEDGVIAKNDKNTLLFVFLPFFASFLFSIVGNISLGLRETIFCKHGFYDASHFIHFVAIVLGQYTFYFCAFLFGLKWFWFKTSLWTSFSIPCLCVYTLFVGFCFAYILHKYVRRRLQFADMLKERPSLKVNTPDYFYFAYKIRAHKRREFYSKAKYISQPYDEDFIEFSEDEASNGTETEEDDDGDYEDTFDDSTAFDDETESASKCTRTDEMVSTPKARERKKEAPKITVFQEFENQAHKQHITDISTLTILTFIFVILVMIGVQMLLIPLKIDGIISEPWRTVFTPCWLIMFILICGLPAWITWEIATKTNLDKKTISVSVDVISDESGKKSKMKYEPDQQQHYAFFTFGACPLCITIPLLISLIVLVSTLDGANIPFVVSASLFAFWEFVFGGLYLMIVTPYTLARNVWDV